jgi:lysophospholipase L1-like esterase
MMPKAAKNQKRLWPICAFLIFAALFASCSSKGGPDREQALMQRPASLCREYGRTIGTTLLLGDSNTWNMPADILPGDYVNCGINGNRSENLILQLPVFLSLYRPKMVSIMIGTNDIKDGRSLDAFLTDCSSLIAMADQHGVALLFRSIPPTSGGWAEINLSTQIYSDALEQLLKRKSIAYVDHRSAWMDGNGVFRGDMTIDGLHLNRSGYKVIKERFYSVSTR